MSYEVAENNNAGPVCGNGWILFMASLRMGRSLSQG